MQKNSSSMQISSEIKRKLIHLTTILIPVLYGYCNRREMLWISGSFLFFALLVEIARFLWKPFSDFFYNLFSTLLRDNEKHCLTGATYIFIGIFLSILFFDKWIAQTVMLFIIVSDAFSAVAGKVWGRHKIYAGKTLEGCLAYLFSGIIIICFIIESDLIVGIAGIIASLLAEIFITRVDDNVSVSIIGGGTMQLLSIMNIC